MASGFVDKREIEDFLRVVEVGSNYLNGIMPDLNDNPFAFAVESYLQNIDEKLKAFRKILGRWPALLDHRHPAYAEMYAAAQKITDDMARQQVNSIRGRSEEPDTPLDPPLLN